VTPAPNAEQIPAFEVPCTFKDGSRAGTTLSIPNDVHHFNDRKTGEEWYRWSEAPGGVLRSWFSLVQPAPWRKG
jgi:hypothetical protein